MKIVQRGVFILFILFATFQLANAEEVLNLTLTRETFGTGQPLEGYVLLNLTEPVPKDAVLLFIIDDIAYGNKTVSQLTQLQNTTRHPAAYTTTGGPATTMELRFARPGSKLELAVNLSKVGITHRDLLDILDFSVSIQGSQGITSPSIDIGNDKDTEWTYVGPQRQGVFVPISDSYLRDKQPDAEVSLTGNADDLYCQNLTLPAATVFKVKALGKSLTSTGALKAAITATRPASTQDVCQGQDPSCCTFPTRPTSLQEHVCTIAYDNPAPRPGFVCAYLELPPTEDISQERYTLGVETSSPAYGFRAGRKVPVNYYLSAEHQDYERQLSTTVTPVLENAVEELKSHAKRRGCADNCLLVPFNISSKSAGTLTLSNLRLKLDTNLGRFTLTTFTPISYTPEKISYNKSILREQLHTYPEVRVPTIEREGVTVKAVLGDFESNEVTFDVVKGPTATIRYTADTLNLGQAVTVEAAVTPVEGRPIRNYAWDFGDGTTATGKNSTHLYSMPGSYTLTLTATDKEGIAGTATQTIVVITPDLQTQLSTTEQDLTALKTKLQQHSTLATTLRLGTILEAAAANLTVFKAEHEALATLTPPEREAREQALSQKLSSLRTTTPRDLLVHTSITFDAQATGLQDIPSSITKNNAAVLASQQAVPSKATLLSIFYQDGRKEQLILVEKTLQGSGDYYELLPSSVTLHKALSPLHQESPGIYTSTTPTITYLLQADTLQDLTTATQTKSIVLSSDLPPRRDDQGKLPSINCGNDSCEPGEDAVICPEDCKTAPPLYPFILLGLALLFGILWIFAYKGKYSFTYFFKKPIISSIFMAEKSRQTLRTYITQSLTKGFTHEQIKLSLRKKGWTDQQITAAFEDMKKKN
ncbi:MAG TPA: PKD domain-containing protein [Candidatus Nanoarchaeia archaeon]|nr:PKD domain-containing protein [Candidatus Nanoarchaeia archaeon]